MLDLIRTESRRTVVFRMAAYHDDAEFLDQNGFDEPSSSEVVDLLRITGLLDSLEDLLEDPFYPKPWLQKTTFPVSRFSDGSFAVFYGALEVETATAEVRHHFVSRFFGEPNGRRVAWYQRFACDFTGSVKDLRPKRKAWPELTHGSDYGLCNRLDAEARERSLDGLLAPSARCDGTNLPVFIRSALSNARDLEFVSVK